MPKNKISEFSSTPANNTDIGGIDIAEGCAPSGINNAIRELMAQLKDQQAGTDADSFTVGGALSVAGTSTLTGAVSAPAGITGNLTGNVIAVDITSTGNTILGNASTDTLNVGNGGLIKDASGNVGIGVTPSAWSGFKAVQLTGGAAIAGSTTDLSTVSITSNAYYSGSSWTYINTAPAARYNHFDGVHSWFTSPSGTAGTAVTFSTRMTLDNSGNVGIGTTSITKKVSIDSNQNGIRLGHGFTLADYSELTFSSGSLVGSGASIRSYRSTATYNGNEGDLRFYTNTGAGGASSDGVEAMRITDSGSVNITGLTASQAVATDASKNLVSVATTGTGNYVLATSPTLVTPALGTPASGNLANCTFPTLNQNTTGTALNVTGTVAVANGGTGLATLTANNVILGNGTSAPSFVAPSTTGNVLTSNGTTWQSAAPSVAWVVSDVSSSSTITTGTTSYSIASNTLMVLGTAYHIMGANLGSSLGVRIKNSGGTTLSTYTLTGGNEINGNDGGSNMTSRSAWSVAVPSAAIGGTLEFFRASGSAQISLIINQVVKSQ
jgi:hypothetical protein